MRTISGVRAFRIVLILVAVGTQASVAQHEVADSNSPVAAKAAGAAPTITYDFVRPGLSVPRYTIVLHEDGTGT